MVFSSIPAYLDPANWQQQQPNYQTGSSGISLPPPPPPPPPQTHGAGGSGSIRPGSMADRARMANIPMPETALKCPRCESTNTKFCYFNNYSLSQPRHFCKTCRRYWTRGGALRTVPVGGGCRRNKRSSKASSKSPANSETASGSTSSTLPPNSTGTAGNNILGGLTSQIPQLRFMAPLSQFTDHYGTGEIGLINYTGISSPVINLFGGSGGGGAGVEQWRLPPVQAQQFPNFLGGFDPSRQGGIVYPNYNYQGDGVNVSGSGGFVGAKLLNSSTISELASVKMEGNNNNQEHQSNFARQFLGSVQDGNEHQWGTAGTTTAWTDLSGFSSSSTSNPLQDL